jgi:hypothetical protein
VQTKHACSCEHYCMLGVPKYEQAGAV